MVLDGLKSWAEAARSRPDSKAGALLRWLKETVKPGGVWNDTRVIPSGEALPGIRSPQVWSFTETEKGQH